jgi:hypothetical protein
MKIPPLASNETPSMNPASWEARNAIAATRTYGPVATGGCYDAFEFEGLSVKSSKLSPSRAKAHAWPEPVNKNETVWS